MAFTLEQRERARAIRAAMTSASPIVARNGSSDDVIRAMPLFAPWTPGQYAASDVATYNGAPYKCVQPHDSAQNPGWSPDEAAALWAPYHGTTPETALPWKQPTGAHDMYRAGEHMIWTDSKVYKAKSDTNFSPSEYAQSWTVI